LKQLTVLSGKGGTGKTSIVASFSALSKNSVIADCDVDAANLSLVTGAHIVSSETFCGGKKARINQKACVGCGRCKDLCRFDAIKDGAHGEFYEETFEIDLVSCEGCGVCVYFCPQQAIELSDVVSGEWFLSDTCHGTLVHARLGIAQENSGKLVTLVRTNAQRVAEERNRDLIIIDGAPGIGCPVIASVTGADCALMVAEPTLSGLHDLKRICELTAHFQIPTFVCVNKHDLNPEMTRRIAQYSSEHGLQTPGNVRYDPAVTQAQISGTSVVEYADNGAADDIRKLWRNVAALLE
jgi:MinD superfamily P-loop ATPase